MNNIIRRDPFREILSLRSSMDRMFDDAFFRTRWDWEPVSADLALDVAETEDEFVVKASIPGINPDDLDITFTGKTLTIRGEFKEEEEKEEIHYHLRERRYGSFARSVTLTAGIDSESIQAKYEGGVLTLTLPKVEEIKPKRITVHAESPQMIEGKATEVISKN